MNENLQVPNIYHRDRKASHEGEHKNYAQNIEDQMKASLPNFSKERGFSKSARKIKKVVTMIPSNK